MLDPEIGAVVVAGLVAKKALSATEKESLTQRLLGPLADVWGADLAAWGTRRTKNAEAILVAAGKMTPSNDALTPNMRVTAEIVENGSWTENPVSQAYLGGLFAGCRSIDGQADSNGPWAVLTNGLSSHEIVLHYLVYRAIAEQSGEVALGPEAIQNESLLWLSRVKFSISDFFRIVGLDDSECVLTEAIIGLRRRDLLHDIYSCEGQTGRAVVTPTHAGALLFLKAHGIQEEGLGALAGFDVSKNPSLAELLEGLKDFPKSFVWEQAPMAQPSSNL